MGGVKKKNNPLTKGDRVTKDGGDPVGAPPHVSHR